MLWLQKFDKCFYFSPCSPALSAKAPISSDSRTSSTAAKLKPGNEENIKIPPPCLDINYEQTTPAKAEKTPSLKPLHIATELKNECIPKLNVIPSSPLPSNSNVEDLYTNTVENIEKIIHDLKVKEGLEKVTVIDSNQQEKYSKPDELEIPTCNSQSKPDSPSETKCTGGELVPVIMKIEHIDENKASALNLQSTQQFPVVTRRFRQLPRQCSTEDVEEAPKQAQEISNAQANIAPSPDRKCEISEIEPKKYTSDSGANFCELQVGNQTKALTSEINDSN